jgi:GDPmannose 4,6-dehydratase
LYHTLIRFTLKKGSSFMADKVALITGISGQDGSYLAEFLLEKGYRVVGLIRRSTHYHYENISHLLGKVTLEFGDLIDPYLIEDLIARYQPSEVYNIAAQSVPADSWKQPMVTAQITALAPIRIMESILKQKPDTRFYQASSREIYGAVPQSVVDESTPFAANNPYGIAKLYAHLMVANYRQSYNLFTCGGILFNHESERRSLHFVSRKVSMAVACIKLNIEDSPADEFGMPLVINRKMRLGNLDAVRDWGYAKEYVEAIWLMLQRPTPTDYVIATNTAYTVRNLCEIAFAHVGLDWQEHVEVDPHLLRPTEIEPARGDYSKAETELGWKPKVFFPELIQQMVDKDIERLSRELR